MPTNDQIKQTINDLLDQTTNYDDMVEVATTIAGTVRDRVSEHDDSGDDLADLALTICGN